MLAPPGWSTSSTDTDYIKLDWFLSPSFPFLILSFSCARRPSSFVPYCLHLPHGGLHIWGIRENSSAVDIQATEILLVSICSFSTGTVGPPNFSNWTVSSPINNGAKSELSYDELKIWAMQSGVTERMIGTREWRGRREFPKGALKIVWSGTMYALWFLFIDNSTHIHCSSSGRPRFPGPTPSLSSFSIPSSAICDKPLTMFILVSTKSGSR